ncbi:hypothetical protein ACJU26_08780 [Acidithiobacillus sp. M4-SHS-6]|uniref:hypothetical protein n=1 Tax=Acidithiobacillus sp. M4-SHS-6 TaxID=3383024 RepID=UPI0039BE36D9
MTIENDTVVTHGYSDGDYVLHLPESILEHLDEPELPECLRVADNSHWYWLKDIPQRRWRNH